MIKLCDDGMTDKVGFPKNRFKSMIGKEAEETVIEVDDNRQLSLVDGSLSTVNCQLLIV